MGQANSQQSQLADLVNTTFTVIDTKSWKTLLGKFPWSHDDVDACAALMTTMNPGVDAHLSFVRNEEFSIKIGICNYRQMRVFFCSASKPDATTYSVHLRVVEAGQNDVRLRSLVEGIILFGGMQRASIPFLRALYTFTGGNNQRIWQRIDQLEEEVKQAEAR